MKTFNMKNFWVAFPIASLAFLGGCAKNGRNTEVTVPLIIGISHAPTAKDNKLLSDEWVENMLPFESAACPNSRFIPQVKFVRVDLENQPATDLADIDMKTTEQDGPLGALKKPKELKELLEPIRKQIGSQELKSALIQPEGAAYDWVNGSLGLISKYKPAVLVVAGTQRPFGQSVVENLKAAKDKLTIPMVPVDAVSEYRDVLAKSNCNLNKDDARKTILVLDLPKSAVPPGQPGDPSNNSNTGTNTSPNPAPPTGDRAAAQDQFRLGAQAFSREKYTDALAAFTKAFQLDPKYGEALLNRSVTNIKLGKMEDAERDLLKLAEFEPNNPLMHYNLAVVYAKKGDVQKSLDAIDTALQKGFDKFDALKTDYDLAKIRRNRRFDDILRKYNVDPLTYRRTTTAY